jgi:hypothetical protein
VANVDEKVGNLSKQVLEGFTEIKNEPTQNAEEVAVLRTKVANVDEKVGNLSKQVLESFAEIKQLFLSKDKENNSK